MTLYVARHGQTAWNARNAVCGRTDLPLTERGLAQARELAEQALHTYFFDTWKGHFFDFYLENCQLRRYEFP